MTTLHRTTAQITPRSWRTYYLAPHSQAPTGQMRNKKWKVCVSLFDLNFHSPLLSFLHWVARKLQTIFPRLLRVPNMIRILLSNVLT